ncbi:hypothetical protein A3842_23705 [Paenibacillus sp. P3E]|nr:hypothetical protein A3842_23705 [Paenibacillus sp. P3E]
MLTKLSLCLRSKFCTKKIQDVMLTKLGLCLRSKFCTKRIQDVMLTKLGFMLTKRVLYEEDSGCYAHKTFRRSAYV